LQGVTKVRERAWLARWLKAPDKLLAEKDPIARDLFERYNKVKMPNFKLDDAEVEGLLKYLEDNDKAVKE
jgi:protein SCO1/2